MPFPTTPVIFVPPGNCRREFRQQELAGPWEYGDALYGCFSNIQYFDVPPMTDGYGQMYKSTDRGETWSVVDPQLSSFWEFGGTSLDGRATPSFARMGNAVYLSWPLRVDASFEEVKWSICKFDFVLDSWVLISSDGPQVKLRLVDRQLTDLSSPMHRNVNLRAKSNGVLYLIYNGGYNGADWMMPTYVSWTSPELGGGATGTWGTPVTIRDDAGRHHYIITSVAVGNKIHMIMGSDTNRYPTQTTDKHLHHVCLQADLTLGAYGTITTDISNSPNANVGIVAYDPGGGELTVSTLSRTTNDTFVHKQNVYIAPEEAEPTWVLTELPFAPEPATNWRTPNTHANPDGMFFTCPFYYDQSLFVMYVTDRIVVPASSPEQCTIWLYKRVDSGWDLSIVFDLHKENPDDPDGESFYKLGSMQPLAVGEGMGLFFMGSDDVAQTERGNDIAQREYYVVLTPAFLGEGPEGPGGEGGDVPDNPPDRVHCVLRGVPGITPALEIEEPSYDATPPLEIEDMPDERAGT